MSVLGKLTMAGAATVLLTLGGCATLEAQRSAVPAGLVATAQPRGYERIRFWGDEASPAMREAVNDHYRRIKAASANGVASVSTRKADFLALSGGGGDGAFGAGLLKGWSERGDRPDFDVVTGISTGALAAPFAFLGTSYDGALEEIYTSYRDQDLYTTKGPLALVSGSVNDTAPLKRLIEQYVTTDVVERIGAEDRTGRRLLVETTNLDAQRPVIWDLTAIAASKRPDRRDLFIRLLLASAAIPAVFPAQRIAVTSDGRTFDELHVDGGVSAQIFFAPPQLKLGLEERKVFGHTRRRTLYAIRNGKLAAEYEPVEDGTLAIAKRAIATMIKNQGAADIAALARDAKANGASMLYAAIPSSFTASSRGDFDPVYMKQLFELGREMGLSGRWTGAEPEGGRPSIAANPTAHFTEAR